MGVTWTRELFERLYSSGYTRDTFGGASQYEARAARVMAGAPRRALVAGAGYGFLSEVLLDAGVEVVSIDSSSWIAATADENVRPDVEVLPSDLRDPGVADMGEFDVVVLDDLDPGYHDAEETLELARAARALSSTVIHFVTEGPGDSILCWRSLGEWSALAPDQAWFSAAG